MVYKHNVRFVAFICIPLFILISFSEFRSCFEQLESPGHNGHFYRPKGPYRLKGALVGSDQIKTTEVIFYEMMWDMRMMSLKEAFNYKLKIDGFRQRRVKLLQ